MDSGTKRNCEGKRLWVTLFVTLKIFLNFWTTKVKLKSNVKV